MVQMIFNDISAEEMTRVPLGVQLKLLMKLNLLPEDEAEFAGRGVEVAFIEGRVFHRISENGWSVYFEKHPQGLYVVRAAEE